MRSSRLLSMLLLLQTHERMTSKELAQRFEVSERTVLRDVEALSAAGIPVYTDRGRHGGIVLDHRARLNPARLEPAEIQFLSVVGIDATHLERIGQGAIVASTREKLAAVAARDPSKQVVPLSEVLLLDPSGWFADNDEADLTQMLDVARARKRLHIRYRRSGETVAMGLTVDPYGLVCKAASWYLIGDVNGQPRMFNTIRIAEYRVLDEPAILRPGEDLRSVWTALLASFEPEVAVEIQALLRANRLDLARRILGARIGAVADHSPGWVSITVHYPDVESVRQLLQFGDHIRVLAPAEAVARFHALAEHIAAHHRPAESSAGA